jgi:hypothetical protein
MSIQYVQVIDNNLIHLAERVCQMNYGHTKRIVLQYVAMSGTGIIRRNYDFAFCASFKTHYMKLRRQ